jgi:hypothetical protein
MSAKVNAYLDWVQTAEALLRHYFADTDLIAGLLGERYWHIASLPVGCKYSEIVWLLKVSVQVRP